MTRDQLFKKWVRPQARAVRPRDARSHALRPTGIQGLLQNLRSITSAVRLEDYEGLVAGVDAHGWLHRGAHCCAAELAQGIDTDKCASSSASFSARASRVARLRYADAPVRARARRYVRFCLDRVELLRTNGVRPMLVFDGATHPLKRELCDERRRSGARRAPAKPRA